MAIKAAQDREVSTGPALDVNAYVVCNRARGEARVRCSPGGLT
jgi:hypothetical protein